MTTQRKSQDELAQTILDAIASEGISAKFIWGIVQSGPDATTPPTLTATLGGSSEPTSFIAYADSYSPAAGDKVLVLVMDTDRFVLCAQAS